MKTMKEYIKPECDIIEMRVEGHLLNPSQVNAYNETGDEGVVLSSEVDYETFDAWGLDEE